MARTYARRTWMGWVLLVLVSLGLSAAATLEAADGPDDALYASALARERGLREPGAQPSLNDLRGTIAVYETLVHRYPGSPFGAHALWQAAGLAVEAYAGYRSAQDLRAGRALLDQLTRDHPDGAFATRASERRRRLEGLTRIAWLDDVRRERHADGVRIVVRLDREVGFRAHRIDDPSRLYFDLAETDAAPALRNGTLTFEGDMVREVRLGRHPDRMTRVVVDTEGASGCDTATMHEPFRIVVDCQSPVVRPDPPALVPLAAVGASVSPPPAPADLGGATGELRILEDEALDVRRLEPIPGVDPVVDPDPDFSVARQLGLGISRIVIDPGHGGRDPGAHAHDLSESDLVLDIALRLEQRLRVRHPELEVVLTRRDDRYVPLEARTGLANRAGADLFVSIHANANRNRSTRGVETYLLDFATDAGAEALAARENVGGGATMAHLDGLLQAIAATSKQDESRALAAALQSALVDRLRAVSPELPDLGVKQAPFVVLIGARMPSVLTEISFVTNEHDAALLATAAYRERIAEALSEGIFRYWRSLGLAPAAAVADAGDF